MATGQGEVIGREGLALEDGGIETGVQGAIGVEAEGTVELVRTDLQRRPVKRHNHLAVAEKLKPSTQAWGRQIVVPKRQAGEGIVQAAVAVEAGEVVACHQKLPVGGLAQQVHASRAGEPGCFFPDQSEGAIEQSVGIESDESVVGGAAAGDAEAAAANDNPAVALNHEAADHRVIEDSKTTRRERWVHDTIGEQANHAGVTGAVDRSEIATEQDSV